MGLFSKVKKIFSPKNIAGLTLAPMTGGLSLLATDLGGEITGQNSAKKANQKNIDLQNYWNERNIQNQNYWNQTQVELANTAHQREVADLIAAGLNPILSAGGSGATTPALSAAQGIAGTVQNELPGGYLAQIGQVGSIVQGIANTKNLITNSGLQHAQTNATNLDTAIKNKMAPATIAQAKQNVENSIANQKLIQAQTDHTAKQIANTEMDTKLKRKQKEKMTTLKSAEGKAGLSLGILGNFGLYGGGSSNN